jgi:uncharacterized repeat protein (TIGR03803 family)
MTNEMQLPILPSLYSQLPRLMTTVVTAAGILFLATTSRAQSQETHPPSFSVLYSFTGGADGANPGGAGIGDLFLDEQGNLYGGASFGADTSAACGSYGCGVVFKLDRKGRESVLHTFSGPPDGAYPYSGVIRDEEGNLFGTAAGGGTGALAAGTVYKLDRAGNETVLHSFTGGTDGNGPDGGLIRDKQGNLYGTTILGGDLSSCGGDGCGVVFKMDRSGKETVLHNFAGLDGAFPGASLVQDEEGTLYGTTNDGGAFGQGVLFKLDPKGKETVLYSFTGGSDGGQPEGLMRDEDGSLYGVAQDAGAFGNGVLYKLDEYGTFTVLHAFTGGADGGVPYGTPLRIGSDVYGTTFFGGNLTTCGGFCGVVYKVDKGGNETVLYSFTGGADGANPTTGLVTDYEGNLYGATYAGGDLPSPAYACFGIGCGVIYKITLH